MKSNEQWEKDNSIPPDAGYYYLHNAFDVIKIINARLKKLNLIVRTKHRRNYGTGSYLWIETLKAIKPMHY